jgi:methionyl-tRNA formyltransferase
MTLRLAFMGTPEFSVPTLKALLESEHEVAVVYTQPPRPAGRGKKLQKSPIHLFAEHHGIEVRCPVSLKSEDEKTAFSELNLDIAIVVAYGLILPKAILDAPRLGAVNIHASLLPRWRGAAPIHRAIMAGDEKSGIAIMQMDVGLDTGDVLAMADTPISSTTTTLELHDNLASMGAGLLLTTLGFMEMGMAHATPQATDGITYAEKIDKAESRINWQDTAQEIDRKVRGLFPFPGAWCEINGERIKILKGTPVEQQGGVGELLDQQLTIGCGLGAYRVESAQRAGKKPMLTDELLRGLDVSVGEVLK